MNKNLSLLSFLQHISNILIVLSLLGTVVLLAPILTAYVGHSQPVVQATTGYIIKIPKINAVSPIVLNVNPWNESQYKKALQHGVAQAIGTALPGEQGTTYLFAHSSGNPWEQARFNTVFLRLGELTSGDPIQIFHGEKLFTYIVKEKKEVLPTDVEYLINHSSHSLILQTCTPIGTVWKRLLVFADKTDYGK